jgi:hypothetical protein
VIRDKMKSSNKIGKIEKKNCFVIFKKVHITESTKKKTHFWL